MLGKNEIRSNGSFGALNRENTRIQAMTVCVRREYSVSQEQPIEERRKRLAPTSLASGEAGSRANGCESYSMPNFYRLQSSFDIQSQRAIVSKEVLRISIDFMPLLFPTTT